MRKRIARFYSETKRETVHPSARSETRRKMFRIEPEVRLKHQVTLKKVV